MGYHHGLSWTEYKILGIIVLVIFILILLVGIIYLPIATLKDIKKKQLGRACVSGGAWLFLVVWIVSKIRAYMPD
jgi:hypothetical protein